MGDDLYWLHGALNSLSNRTESMSPKVNTNKTNGMIVNRQGTNEKCGYNMHGQPINQANELKVVTVVTMYMQYASLSH